MADEIGNKDVMAVITSSQALDVFAINDAINQNKSIGFASAVNMAINRNAISSVNFTANNGTIDFATPTGDKTAVAVIVEMNKQ